MTERGFGVGGGVGLDGQKARSGMMAMLGNKDGSGREDKYGLPKLECWPRKVS